jgi:hypothetical protein
MLARVMATLQLILVIMDIMNHIILNITLISVFNATLFILCFNSCAAHSVMRFYALITLPQVQENVHQGNI